MSSSSSRPSSRSLRPRSSISYAALDSGASALELEGGDSGAAASRFSEQLQAKLPSLWPRQGLVDVLAHGSQVTLPWLRSHGLQRPVLIEDSAGLGLAVPGPSFAVRDVAATVGRSWPIEVLDVSAQSEVPGKWTLGDWADYYHSPAAERKRVLNVITLEFSGTPLRAAVRSPNFVRQLDWIDNVFPGARQAAGEYPTVQYYCLMSVAGSWTDFHVDFGGSTVWYHVHTGSKTFLFVPPTPAALRAYEEWTSSPSQASTFFTDTLPAELR